MIVLFYYQYHVTIRGAHACGFDPVVQRESAIIILITLVL